MAMTSQTSLPVPVSRARGPAGRAIEEPDERMLVHAQALFDVPLREGARRKMHSLGVPAQARDSRIVQADAERMTHVVHCSAARYIVNSMCSRPVPSKRRYRGYVGTCRELSAELRARKRRCEAPPL